MAVVIVAAHGAVLTGWSGAEGALTEVQASAQAPVLGWGPDLCVYPSLPTLPSLRTPSSLFLMVSFPAHSWAHAAFQNSLFWKFDCFVESFCEDQDHIAYCLWPLPSLWHLSVPVITCIPCTNDQIADMSGLNACCWQILFFSFHSLYSTLLAHKKLHIRNFAAESFTFLMRKVSVIPSVFIGNKLSRIKWLDWIVF